MAKKKNANTRPSREEVLAKKKAKEKKELITIGIVAAAVIAVAVAIFFLINGLNHPTLDKDFTVYDANGKAVQLSDYAGKPIVLNFWASWCGPCKNEMPDFQKAYETYGKDVQFLMVNLTHSGKETQDTAKAFIQDNQYSFPVLFDLDSDAAEAYNITVLPSTFFIDKDGKVVASYERAINEAVLKENIEKIK